jgi:hypothetical protein
MKKQVIVAIAIVVAVALGGLVVFGHGHVPDFNSVTQTYKGQ